MEKEKPKMAPGPTVGYFCIIRLEKGFLLSLVASSDMGQTTGWSPASPAARWVALLASSEAWAPHL